MSKITLYHGSHVAVTQPLAKVGRRNLDFGRGFYITKLKSQAEAWAVVVAGRKGRSVVPVVSIYEMDLEQAISDGARHKIFPKYNLEWLDYVVSCRRGDKEWEKYDIVEGGVANDNVIDTVEDYEKGIITAEQALGQLQYKKINHQICIVNQSIIDKYLSYQGCEQLNMEEEDV